MITIPATSLLPITSTAPPVDGEAVDAAIAQPFLAVLAAAVSAAAPPVAPVVAKVPEPLDPTGEEGGPETNDATSPQLLSDEPAESTPVARGTGRGDIAGHASARGLVGLDRARAVAAPQAAFLRGEEAVVVERGAMSAVVPDTSEVADATDRTGRVDAREGDNGVRMSVPLQEHAKGAVPMPVVVPGNTAAPNPDTPVATPERSVRAAGSSSDIAPSDRGLPNPVPRAIPGPAVAHSIGGALTAAVLEAVIPFAQTLGAVPTLSSPGAGPVVPHAEPSAVASAAPARSTPEPRAASVADPLRTALLQQEGVRGVRGGGAPDAPVLAAMAVTASPQQAQVVPEGAASVLARMPSGTGVDATAHKVQPASAEPEVASGLDRVLVVASESELTTAGDAMSEDAPADRHPTAATTPRAAVDEGAAPTHAPWVTAQRAAPSAGMTGAEPAAMPSMSPEPTGSPPPATSHVTVELDPETAGAQRVRVAVRGDVVNATVITDAGGVDALRPQLTELRQALEGHGFREANVQVRIAGEGQLIGAPGATHESRTRMDPALASDAGAGDAPSRGRHRDRDQQSPHERGHPDFEEERP